MRGYHAELGGGGEVSGMGVACSTDIRISGFWPALVRWTRMQASCPPKAETGTGRKMPEGNQITRKGNRKVSQKRDLTPTADLDKVPRCFIPAQEKIITSTGALSLLLDTSLDALALPHTVKPTCLMKGVVVEHVWQS